MIFRFYHIPKKSLKCDGLILGRVKYFFKSLWNEYKGCFPQIKMTDRILSNKISENTMSELPIPGEAKAKAMPGWLYIHTINNK